MHESPDPRTWKIPLLLCPSCGERLYTLHDGASFFFQCDCGYKSERHDTAEAACSALYANDDQRLLSTLSQHERRILEAFVREVNRRAERAMLKTGKLEGSHHAAMLYLAKALILRVDQGTAVVEAFLNQKS